MFFFKHSLIAITIIVMITFWANPVVSIENYNELLRKCYLIKLKRII